MNENKFLATWDHLNKHYLVNLNTIFQATKCNQLNVVCKCRILCFFPFLRDFVQFSSRTVLTTHTRILTSLCKSSMKLFSYFNSKFHQGFIEDMIIALFLFILKFTYLFIYLFICLVSFLYSSFLFKCRNKNVSSEQSPAASLVLLLVYFN